MQPSMEHIHVICFFSTYSILHSIWSNTLYHTFERNATCIELKIRFLSFGRNMTQLSPNVYMGLGVKCMMRSTYETSTQVATVG